jgi:hypothetical protein
MERRRRSGLLRKIEPSRAETGEDQQRDDLASE